jgi:stage II sporulation protein AA (anti-sigma F factor antagonist)
MEILESRTKELAILHVIGRVNSSNAFELDERLRLLVQGGCRAIVLDLDRLDHMTSAGFRCLLRAEKQVLDTAGRLVLCGLHGLTLELFETAGYLEMFVVAKSRDEALRQAAA